MNEEILEQLPQYAKVLRRWFLELGESPSSKNQEDSDEKI